MSLLGEGLAVDVLLVVVVVDLLRVLYACAPGSSGLRVMKTPDDVLPSRSACTRERHRSLSLFISYFSFGVLTI